MLRQIDEYICDNCAIRALGRDDPRSGPRRRPGWTMLRLGENFQPFTFCTESCARTWVFNNVTYLVAP